MSRFDIKRYEYPDSDRYETSLQVEQSDGWAGAGEFYESTFQVEPSHSRAGEGVFYEDRGRHEPAPPESSRSQSRRGLSARDEPLRESVHEEPGRSRSGQDSGIQAGLDAGRPNRDWDSDDFWAIGRGTGYESRRGGRSEPNELWQMPSNATTSRTTGLLSSRTFGPEEIEHPSGYGGYYDPGRGSSRRGRSSRSREPEPEEGLWDLFE